MNATLERKKREAFLCCVTLKSSSQFCNVLALQHGKTTFHFAFSCGELLLLLPEMEQWNKSEECYEKFSFCAIVFVIQTFVRVKLFPLGLAWWDIKFQSLAGLKHNETLITNDMKYRTLLFAIQVYTQNDTLLIYLLWVNQQVHFFHFPPCRLSVFPFVCLVVFNNIKKLFKWKRREKGTIMMSGDGKR